MKQQTLSAQQPPATYAGLQITAQLPVVRESTKTMITTPQAISDACEDMRMLAQDAFVVFTLDSKNMMISRHLISLGLLDTSLVHPREVFRPALLDGARTIIVAHNHPSGDPTPSGEDIKITQQLVEAGKILRVQILDHVIIGRETAGRDSWFSLRESGTVTFE